MQVICGYAAQLVELVRCDSGVKKVLKIVNTSFQVRFFYLGCLQYSFSHIVHSANSEVHSEIGTAFAKMFSSNPVEIFNFVNSFDTHRRDAFQT